MSEDHPCFHGKGGGGATAADGGDLPACQAHGGPCRHTLVVAVSVEEVRAERAKRAAWLDPLWALANPNAARVAAVLKAVELAATGRAAEGGQNQCPHCGRWVGRRLHLCDAPHEAPDQRAA